MRSGDLQTIPDTPVCCACAGVKQIRDSFRGSIFTATNTGDAIHSDVSGPLPRSRSGCKHTVPFIDEHSRYVTMFAIKCKSEVLTWFKAFKREFERQNETKINVIHSENRGEFTLVAKFAARNGIVVYHSAPYTPQANGIAERTNRTIFEMARGPHHPAAIRIAQTFLGR
jgi:transposase InsO family protein